MTRLLLIFSLIFLGSLVFGEVQDAEYTEEFSDEIAKYLETLSGEEKIRSYMSELKKRDFVAPGGGYFCATFSDSNFAGYLMRWGYNNYFPGGANQTLIKYGVQVALAQLLNSSSVVVQWGYGYVVNTVRVTNLHFQPIAPNAATATTGSFGLLFQYNLKKDKYFKANVYAQTNGAFTLTPRQFTLTTAACPTVATTTPAATTTT
eukprot:TRINITY_DN2993_c0_g1_i1.p1 TRINITY_DN2993_c0_g1~~TRINITY_DN2993_c0_g1_i1.p1  ORF type:complete len:230 (+),score=85.36 TRINITY_DN2993_c0_g1_i1:77-691(+)